MERVVEKVWGEEEWIVNNDLYCSKLLHIKPGYVCSDHRHPIKDETFYVLAGHGAVRIGGGVRQVKVGDTIRIEPLTWHCFATAAGMTLLEISTHHEDADVERMTCAPSHELSWDNDDDCSMLRASGAVVPEAVSVRLGWNLQ
jgi:mannose-6-phosphate isomerase-like protein (cupin superfamily)